MSVIRPPIRVLRPATQISRIILTFDDRKIEIKTPEQVLKDAQDHVCKLVPPTVSLVDELIADRRAEAQRELED